MIPKILHHLNVVWLFNVKQGFCLSRTLLLFGVVPNFFYIFQIRGFQCFFSLLYKIWSITTRDICLHSTVEVCFSSFKNTTIPPRNADSSVSWNFKKQRDSGPPGLLFFHNSIAADGFFLNRFPRWKTWLLTQAASFFRKEWRRCPRYFKVRNVGKGVYFKMFCLVYCDVT